MAIIGVRAYGPGVEYLPSCCDSCAVIELRPASECKSAQFSCATCGEPARVIPGGMYAEGDIPLFSELARIVSVAEMPPVDASLLATRIEQSSANGYHRQAFTEVVEVLPALGPTQRVLELSAVRSAQALSMLATILGARAMTRRSGTMAAATEVAPFSPARRKR